ncbi:uncharacterized protein [Mycetomoellerius zeteki]|uniref:uncharacterized protein n=1 Tax=Mycetomoellerius zeteki TaxID=64791 RepID=UPI00084E6D91|nr:PREDICTED: uncharacterized protein LOC108728539 [Trachymyrmex zeteki]
MELPAPAPRPAARLQRPITDCRFPRRKSVSQLRSRNNMSYAPETSCEIPRGGRNTRTLQRYGTMKNIRYLEPRSFEQWDIFGTESATVDNYYPIAGR